MSQGISLRGELAKEHAPPDVKSDRLTRMALVSIILLGFALRLSGFIWGEGYSFFGQGDGLEAYSVAVKYGAGESKALYLGQPNYNKYSKVPGPLWTMFCFAGLRLSHSIEGVALLILLSNVVVIYLTYLIAQQTIGEDSALWSALLCAVSPRAIFFSGLVYNPSVMPMIAGLLILSLLRTLKHCRSRCVFWIPFLLLAMPQFHMSGLGLLVPVVIILILNGKVLNYSWLGLGFFAGCAIYIPYLIGDAAAGWENTRGMFMGQRKQWWDALKVCTSPFGYLVNFSPAWARNSAEYVETGNGCFGHYSLYVAANVVSGIFAACLTIGLFAGARVSQISAFLRAPRAAFAGSRGIAVLALLFLGPFFSMLFSGSAAHSRYFLLLVPVVMTLAAMGISRCLNSPTRLRTAFLCVMAITIAVNVWLVPRMYYQQHQKILTGDLFVPSFRNMERVYQQARRSVGFDKDLVIDDSAYVIPLRNSKDPRLEAGLLSRYVAVREKEKWLAGASPGEVATLQLISIDKTRARHSGIVYAANGIALMRTETPGQ